MNRPRLARWALAALCVLAPAVYTVKAIVRPAGDSFPTPARVPAVPVVLVTLSSVSAHDAEGAQGKQRMPALSKCLRECELFTSVVCAGNDDAASIASILFASLPGDHGVRRYGDGPVGTVNNLATELHAAGYRTMAMLNAPFASACNLTDGFEVVRELGTATGVQLVDALDATLGPTAPTRFFAWLDVRDAHRRAGDDLVTRRRGGLAAVDAAIARLEQMLRRRHLLGDALLVLASDHGDDDDARPPRARFADAVVHGVAAFRFPFDRHDGTQSPGSVSTIDIAPTILALLRIEAPTYWRGKNRLRDLTQMRSSGPAVGGPFLRDGEPAVWTAEDGTKRLAIAEDGHVIEIRDLNDPNAVPPGSSDFPEPFKPLAIAIRNAILAKAKGTAQPMGPEILERLRAEGYAPEPPR